jgi:hypothetical protein
MGPMDTFVLMLDRLGLSMSIFLCEVGLVIIRERGVNILSRTRTTRTRTIGRSCAASSSDEPDRP